MLIFKRYDALQKYLNTQSKSIGFVPTMGALHKGHASLVEIAKKNSDLVVCSIFVNPSQFNDPKDLDKYPRTTEEDIEILTALGTDILYLPSVEDVYPKGASVSVQVDLGQMDQVLEGKFRPGHFKGVLEVVNRFLDIVMPSHLYMGQKDFQQFSLINQMIKQQAMRTELRVCPIIRDEGGLALSSRNALLSAAEKETALILSKTLRWAAEKMQTHSISTICTEATARIEKAGMNVEYFEIVDGATLLPSEEKTSKVICTAAYIGAVRLIDNIYLNAGSEQNSDYFVP